MISFYKLQKGEAVFDLCIWADSNWTDHFENSLLAN